MEQIQPQITADQHGAALVVFIRDHKYGLGKGILFDDLKRIGKILPCVGGTLLQIEPAFLNAGIHKQAFHTLRLADILIRALTAGKHRHGIRFLFQELRRNITPVFSCKLGCVPSTLQPSTITVSAALSGTDL